MTHLPKFGALNQSKIILGQWYFKMSKAKFLALHPVLPVRDVQKAAEQYVERLGFTLIFMDSPE